MDGLKNLKTAIPGILCVGLAVAIVFHQIDIATAVGILAALGGYIGIVAKDAE